MFFPVHSLQLFSSNSLLLGVLNSLLRCVRPLCHCWCPPFSAGHVAFLFTCLPGLSLVVSALFRWPCSVSIHLSPRSVTFSAGHVAFLCMCLPVCRCWCPPFSAGHVAFLFICLPGLPCWGTRLILEPRNGSFWNPDEKKTLRDCSVRPISRLILEHASFGSASKVAFASENECFVRDFLQK